MKDKPYAIYKHNTRIDEKELWHLHRKYDDISKAKQAYADLIRKPRKLRVWVYVLLPTIHHSARAILLKEDILKAAR